MLYLGRGCGGGWGQEQTCILVGGQAASSNLEVTDVLRVSRVTAAPIQGQPGCSRACWDVW